MQVDAYIVLWLLNPMFCPGIIDTEDPGHDDFELWLPRNINGDQEECLFGRQV
jgi:hypothetical protein